MITDGRKIELKSEGRDNGSLEYLALLPMRITRFYNMKFNTIEIIESSKKNFILSVISTD